MNEVNAIKSVNDVKAVLAFFEKHDVRMYHLIRIGINVALRISDLLNLRFDELENMTNNTIVVGERKTSKARSIRFNSKALESVKALKEMNPDHEYLFQAVGNRVKNTVKPISRQYVHRKLKEAQESCELDYEIGTHSLRKTFGYHAYKAGTDIHTLQRLFKHSSSAITLAYIGITAETVADVYEAVSLG